MRAPPAARYPFDEDIRLDAWEDEGDHAYRTPQSQPMRDVLAQRHVAVGEIVPDSSAHRDRGRGELVRRGHFDTTGHRLLLSHDGQGRVFGQVYDSNMGVVLARTYLGNLPPGQASNEANARRWFNQTFGQRLVHWSRRRGGAHGPDMVPARGRLPPRASTGFDDELEPFEG